MSFELDKIDDVDIYSFGNEEFLRDFVAKNNLIEYDLKPEADSDSSQRKYNTRSRLNSDQSRLDDTLSCYLNKLDCEHALLDPAGEDILSLSTSKRHTRSQAGRISLPQCGKIYCRLGCICEQFDNSKKNVNGKHCGRVECMFECNCARKLRSSTRTKDHGVSKASSSGSICSRSSSNSSAYLRKSKRSKNKVNYSSYSKTGSCSDTSAELKPKAVKFRPYIEAVPLNHTHKLKLKILSKNYDSIREKILDFIKHVFNQLALFEWKEFCFSFDKSVTVCLMNKPLLARVSKFKTKEVIRKAELDAICSKFPLVSIHLFRYKKNSANKENKNPDRPKQKALPRLLCRKTSRPTKCESKKIFTNLESLLESLPKKYDKISDSLRNYRDYEKIKLFTEEKEFLSNNDSKILYDPFKDESLVVDCYKKVDSRSLVDSVAETLNDMISVVCTYKENTEKKCEQILSNPIRTEAAKRRPNVIILRHHLQKNNRLASQGKTFVKILNTNEGNKVSIINKLVDEEKPIFKVSYDQSTVTTLATIKQNLQNSGSENKTRKRKQDLSYLATKIIHINHVQTPVDLLKNNKPILISRSLFSKKFKSDKNEVYCPPSLIKQEPEIFFSDSTNSSENYLSLDVNMNTDSMEVSCESSSNYENQTSPRSMLKLDTPCSSIFNTDSSRKCSISSSNSGSFKPSKSYDHELADSDAENEDDYFEQLSDSIKSSDIKNIAVNLHSVRERQRRLRLKNLLSKLKFALYDIDENTSSLKINSSNFKHSKQATLAEAVETIKKLETQGEKLENEFENLKKQNLNLQKRIEFLKKQQNFK